MNQLVNVSVPRVDGFNAELTLPSLLYLSGVLAQSEPGKLVGPFFEDLHRAVVADGLREIIVDVRQLTFVNSSAIRLFVDWAARLRASSETEAYVIRFRTDRRITWQRTSFLVLQSLAPRQIIIEAE